MQQEINDKAEDDEPVESPLGQSGCRRVIEMQVEGVTPDNNQKINKINSVVVEEDFDAEFDMLFTETIEIKKQCVTM